ncbi:diadenylate cyclase CdaA [uncultured Clostridium sp.]|uniref:diadenylate cyclase CdaA n=1 Tax=uncultured Clostridium sp. TaxID=59620 RepID=UPI0025DCFA1D|nr:diadenylate cyclase CdaA [uncultured Clostridium sp.]
MDFFKMVIRIITDMNLIDVIDILVVSYIFYKIYTLINQTRAMQLLKGLALVFVLIPISSFLNLTLLNWILNKTITIGVLSIVIIFQPEIRSALERLGRGKILDKGFSYYDGVNKEVMEELLKAVENMSNSKTGALIVLERNTGLKDITETGVKINADVKSALLETIFFENTALHDGAVVIKDNKIDSAGCFLPLSKIDIISKSIGTRHRAAIGISEVSDAIAIVVSEETGIISLTFNGKLTRGYSIESLEKSLIKFMNKNKGGRQKEIRRKVGKWIGIKEKKD